MKYHFGKSAFRFSAGRGVSGGPLGLFFCFPFCSPPVSVLDNGLALFPCMAKDKHLLQNKPLLYFQLEKMEIKG